MFALLHIIHCMLAFIDYIRCLQLSHGLHSMYETLRKVINQRICYGNGTTNLVPTLYPCLENVDDVTPRAQALACNAESFIEFFAPLYIWGTDSY